MGKNKFKQPGGVAQACAAKKTPSGGASPSGNVSAAGPLQTPHSKPTRTARSRKVEADRAQESDLVAPDNEKLPFKLAVQPVKAKYGGMGLARPSTFVDLRDTAFNEKFERIYYEHVKGWAGFSYTKSRKRQEQGQMLWKQRLNAKQGIEETLPAKPQLPKAKKQRRNKA